jgi:GTP diphosphokinase / guanosine-3',5'-bis(diphosphate) 3'-diphosphatase
MEEEFNKLSVSLEKKGIPTAKINFVKKAYAFAKVAHADQERLSGELYINHPLRVAGIIRDWGLDINSIVAALLHDSIERGAATPNDIKSEFGDEVFSLVDGVTKVSKVKLKGSAQEVFVENLRKMFIAIAKDLRVVFLRFAERIDNLGTLGFLPEDRRLKYAKETLEIYSPLAERLGMKEVKTQMDNLSFPCAYPDEYEKMKKLEDLHLKGSEKLIDRIVEDLSSAIRKIDRDVLVYGRRKSLFSLWNKLKRPEINWDIEKIHDLIAFRVITDSVENCYASMGVVHELYKPVIYIPISDFIANPKPNGYRSIHTKVFVNEDKIAEFQIRTKEMHQQAEFGAAAHWAYSDLKTKSVSDKLLDRVSSDNNKLRWVKELSVWQNKIENDKEFLDAVKLDMLSERIFVFSPKGDVYDLPINSTPVDFAYNVHTDLGNFIKAVLVNGKVKPLDYHLKNGDVVEVVKSRNPRLPTNDWLKNAVTTMAKKEIRRRLKVNGKF